MSTETEEFSFKNRAEYDVFMDKAPNEQWIQKRDLGGGKVHSFLPLFIQNANADFVFKEWHVIDETNFNVSGGVGSTVKILALPSYPDAQHITFTGTAAIMSKSKKNAMEFDIPNARARAIGNALATLGNVFGRNINRTYKINTSEGEQTARVSKDFSLRRKKDD
ncbi:MAG: hypothetical protein KAS30_04205 [Candidatus Diapherotrites archaeon]|nr:hypothetical protein [Candidatus Diapherotrites archaeon]